MKSGVSFPSYIGQATWAQVTGAWNASYPLANLGNLKRIRRVALGSGLGVRAFTFTFPAAVPLQFMSMLHHNGVAGNTIRYRLFSDANPDPVGNVANMIHDSGLKQLFPVGSAPSSDYAQCHPYLLDAALNVRSGRIDLSSHLVTPWQIGGFELSGFWSWPDVTVPREFGVMPADIITELADNVDHGMTIWSPRSVLGSRGGVDQTELIKLLDFQREKGLFTPFVWMWDYDDPTTWPREVFLVTQNRFIAGGAVQYPQARFGFDFGEHLG